MENATDPFGGAELSPIVAFFLQHGRWPMADKGEAPWQYKGHLLFYVQAWHEQGVAGNRWGYYLKALMEDTLPAEPLPRVEYDQIYDERNPIVKDLERCISAANDGWNGLAHFIDYLTYALGVSSERPRVSEKVQEYWYKNVKLQDLMERPADYFSALIGLRKGNSKAWNPTAFFATPMHVCTFMAACLFDEKVDSRRASVLEPCIGTGSMALAAANYSMNIYGIDIDPLVVKCAQINGILYAPWITFPLPWTVFSDDEAVKDRLRAYGPRTPALGRADALRETPDWRIPPEMEVISGTTGNYPEEALVAEMERRRDEHKQEQARRQIAHQKHLADQERAKQQKKTERLIERERETNSLFADLPEHEPQTAPSSKPLPISEPELRNILEARLSDPQKKALQKNKAIYRVDDRDVKPIQFSLFDQIPDEQE